MSFGFFPFVVERKLFTASATASAMLPRPHRQLPRRTFHIWPFRALPRPRFLNFCFRDHSPTTFSNVSGCGWFHFLSFWPYGLHLLSFWPFEPSFPLVLSFWAFIAFHFGLFLFCLGLGHLRASAVLFGHICSFRGSFRAASAKHRSKTGKCRDRCFSFIDLYKCPSEI